MLDSLVRVSRRVGWGADRWARDPELARVVRATTPRGSPRALEPVHTSRTGDEDPGPVQRREGYLGPGVRRPPSSLNTIPRDSYLA